MGFLGKFFGNQPPKREFSEQEQNDYHQLKQAGLEKALDEMGPMVGHAIIPFEAGGAVDMYYFPNHLPGTGFSTMELLDPDGNGPKPNKLGTYELVAFTNKPYSDIESAETPFNTIERHICGLFTTIGRYASQAVLNPLETVEIPNSDGSYSCMVLDVYNELIIGQSTHHLLLCLEVHRSEMEFARSSGTMALIEKLENAGYYPYSDLDREPVV